MPRPRLFKIVVALLLATVVGAGAAGVAAAADTGPTLLNFDFSKHFAVRPATVYFGADGGVFLTGPNVTLTDFKNRRDGHIRWVRWDGGFARGLAAVWIETCRPNCATGGFNRYSGSLRASRVRSGHYTRLVLTYLKNGRAVVKRYGLSRTGGLWGWE